MGSVEQRVDDDDPERLRRRSLRVLVACVALAATGFIAIATVAAIAGKELGGSAAWGGPPIAAGIFGTAVGAGLLSAVSARRGRRAALALGWAAAALGAAAAVVAILAGSLALLIAGGFVIGFANAAAYLSRYVGGELVPRARRASAVGLVVWGSTIGAVIGPNLSQPLGALTSWFGWPATTGVFVVGVAVFAAAAALAFFGLRAHDISFGEPSASAAQAIAPRSGFGAVIAAPAVRIALISLVAAQVLMTLLMTMTPLHLDAHGHGLGVVGLVFSAHTLGMFALSPVAGRLTDRFGSHRVVVAGFGLLTGAGLFAAGTPGSTGPLLSWALFVLGFGWNLAFVAASSILAGGATLAERARRQGVVDVIVWSSSAVASLAAGPLLAVGGFAGISLLVAALAAPPAVLVALAPRHLAAERA